MTITRLLRLPALALAVILLIVGCARKRAGGHYQNTAEYDLNNPKVINLPSSLDEISGIAYYPKDTSVFAIVDEDGLLYKIPLLNPSVLREWQYNDARDYEDMVMKDSLFYMMAANGDLDIIRFDGDKIKKTEVNFPGANKKDKEFEALYWDSITNSITHICKECDDDGKTQISTFRYVDSTGTIIRAAAIPASDIRFKAKTGDDQIKPSAAARHPITGDLYVVCSVNKIMFILSPGGKLKTVVKLDPVLYKQPEGLCFTPEGNLIISNEQADEGSPTLLLMKYKKSKS